MGLLNTGVGLHAVGRAADSVSSLVPFCPAQDDIINLRSQQQSSHEGTRSVLRQMEVSWVWRGCMGELPVPVCRHLSVVCQVACPDTAAESCPQGLSIVKTSPFPGGVEPKPWGCNSILTHLCLSFSF